MKRKLETIPMLPEYLDDADLERESEKSREDFCLSCLNTGMIDSDGFCGNCSNGRALAELDRRDEARISQATGQRFRF